MTAAHARVEVVTVARITQSEVATAAGTTIAATDDEFAFPPPLDHAQAAALTARINQAVEHAEQLVRQAYLGRVWLALGFDSWSDWCAHHFAGRRLIDVARDERQSTVASLHGAGMSNRSIATALGIGEATVRRELAAHQGAPGDAPDGRVMGPDGKWYPARRPAAEVFAHECDVCGEQHAEDDEDCPLLAGVFDPITVGPRSTSQLSDQVRDGVFGPGASNRGMGIASVAGGRDAASKSGGDADGSDADSGDDGEVDSEGQPLAGPVSDAASVARSITRQAESIVKQWMRIAEDLDELPGLLDDLDAILPEWPEGSGVTMPAELAGDGTAALEAVQRWRRDLSTLLTRWAGVIGHLDRLSR